MIVLRSSFLTPSIFHNKKGQLSNFIMVIKKNSFFKFGEFWVSIPKTMMNDDAKVPIGDFESLLPLHNYAGNFWIDAGDDLVVNGSAEGGEVFGRDVFLPLLTK